MCSSPKITYEAPPAVVTTTPAAPPEVVTNNDQPVTNQDNPVVAANQDKPSNDALSTADAKNASEAEVQTNMENPSQSAARRKIGTQRLQIPLDPTINTGTKSGLFIPR